MNSESTHDSDLDERHYKYNAILTSLRERGEKGCG